MASDRATFEAFDGYEIRLPGGPVVRAPVLTVAEAARYLRLLHRARQNEWAAVETFVPEFSRRVGLAEARLADLAFEVEGHEDIWFGDLTLGDAIDLAALYMLAGSDATSADAAKAQMRVNDEFPVAFGLKASSYAETCEFAIAFTKQLYLFVYGLASDFLGHLTRSPRVKVMSVRAPKRRASSSTPASTT